MKIAMIVVFAGLTMQLGAKKISVNIYNNFIKTPFSCAFTYWVTAGITSKTNYQSKYITVEPLKKTTIEVDEPNLYSDGGYVNPSRISCCVQSCAGAAPCVPSCADLARTYTLVNNTTSNRLDVDAVIMPVRMADAQKLDIKMSDFILSANFVDVSTNEKNLGLGGNKKITIKNVSGLCSVKYRVSPLDKNQWSNEKELPLSYQGVIASGTTTDVDANNKLLWISAFCTGNPAIGSRPSSWDIASLAEQGRDLNLKLDVTGLRKDSGFGGLPNWSW